MKKALVVLLAMTCLAAMAFADMAPRTIGVSGEITYGFIGNSANTADGWPNGGVTITTTIDPNNWIVLGLGGWQTLQRFNTYTGGTTENGSTVAANGVYSNYAPIELLYGKTDIGGVLGIDKMLAQPILYGGYGVFDLPAYGVTEYGIERVAAVGIDNGNADGIFGFEAGSAYGLIALDTKVMGMVDIVLATSGLAFAGTNQQALLGAYGVVGPVSFEAGWTPRATAKGYAPLGLQYATSFGDIGLTAMGNVRLDLNPSALTAYGAGAKVTYQMFRVDFSIANYYVGSTSYLMATGDVEATLSPMVAIVISPVLNFNSNAADTFDTLEAFLKITFGAANVKVGYLYMANGKGDLNKGADYAPSSNSNQGGIWLLTDFNF